MLIFVHSFIMSFNMTFNVSIGQFKSCPSIFFSFILSILRSLRSCFFIKYTYSLNFNKMCHGL